MSSIVSSCRRGDDTKHQSSLFVPFLGASVVRPLVRARLRCRVLRRRRDLSIASIAARRWWCHCLRRRDPTKLFSLLSKRFILTTRHPNTMRRVSPPPPPPRSLSSGDATDTQKEGAQKEGCRAGGGRDDTRCARSNKRHDALLAASQSALL